VELDAVVVWPPCDDGLLDLFGVEVFGYGAGGEGGELGVGGEAEGDELLDGDLVDEVEVIFVDEVGEAELLFEADDAVLVLEGVVARFGGHEEEDDREDDPPNVGVVVGTGVVPAMNGRVDGEGEVEEQHGANEEVEDGIPAGVVFEGLRLSHRGP
jgi:hypothetical protein